MLTKQDLLPICATSAKSAAYSVTLMNYALYGTDLPEQEPEGSTDTQLLEGQAEQLFDGMQKNATLAVELSNGTLHYDLSEKIMFTFLKTVNENSLKHFQDLWKEAEKGNDDFIMDLEYAIPSVSADSENESRELLLKYAADHGFNEEQAKIVLKAYDTPKM